MCSKTLGEIELPKEDMRNKNLESAANDLPRKNELKDFEEREYERLMQGHGVDVYMDVLHRERERQLQKQRPYAHLEAHPTDVEKWYRDTNGHNLEYKIEKRLLRYDA